MNNKFTNLGYLPEHLRWLVCVSVPYTLQWEILTACQEWDDAYSAGHTWATDEPESVYAVYDYHRDTWALTVYAETSCDMGAVLVTTYGNGYSEDDYPDV